MESTRSSKKMSTKELVQVSRLRDACRSGLARKIREDREVSLREMGRASAGLGPSTILRWERGEHAPRASRAALAYWASLRELMGVGP